MTARMDPNGPFGSMMTLLSCPNLYNNPRDPQAVFNLATRASVAFRNVAGREAIGMQELVAFVMTHDVEAITPQAMLGTDFFRNMINSKTSVHHEKIIETFVPRMLEEFKKATPEALPERLRIPEVKKWVAGLVESYMSEDQIAGELAIQSTALIQSQAMDQTMAERTRIGALLTQFITHKKIEEQDFDIILDVMSRLMERVEAKNRVGLILGITHQHVNNLFKKTSSTPLITGNQITQEESDIIGELITTLATKIEIGDRVEPILAIVHDYVTLFFNQENPKQWGTQVLNLLTTRYREKMFPKLVAVE